MRKYKQKKSALVIIGVTAIVLAAILTALAAAYLSRYKITMTVLICLFWLIALLFAAVLVPAYFERTVIYISPTDISMQTGILFVKRHHMRMSAVQYVTSVTTFFSKYTGFNFVIIRAMGGGMVLPFLTLSDALDITNLFNSRLSGD